MIIMLTYTHTHKHWQYIPVCVHANKELGLKILNNLENLVFIQYVQPEGPDIKSGPLEWMQSTKLT